MEGERGNGIDHEKHIGKMGNHIRHHPGIGIGAGGGLTNTLSSGEKRLTTTASIAPVPEEVRMNTGSLVPKTSLSFSSTEERSFLKSLVR